MLKKFISIYKKIKDDSNKLNNFLKKISEKLTESYDDIKVLITFFKQKNFEIINDIYRYYLSLSFLKIKEKEFSLIYLSLSINFYRIWMRIKSMILISFIAQMNTIQIEKRSIRLKIK